MGIDQVIIPMMFHVEFNIGISSTVYRVSNLNNEEKIDDAENEAFIGHIVDFFLRRISSWSNCC